MIYLDMDGVLADFNKHYQDRFGIKVDRELDNVDCDLLTGDFFLTIPPMKDIRDLTNYVRKFGYKILTGIPDQDPKGATKNKMGWAWININQCPEVICCPSRDKATYCRPGDVLIDDWIKYKKKWVDAGGIWITHKSAKESIKELKRYGY